MTLFVQQGYGKTDKIEAALRAGVASGVILSPRDESPQNLQTFVMQLREEFKADLPIIIDPQFFVTTINNPNDGYLPDYPYYSPELKRKDFISPKKINEYVQNTLGYQKNICLDGVSKLIAPAVIFSDFKDPWSQIALSLAQQAIEVHETLNNPPPLYISLVIDEQTLKGRDGMAEFLDIVTTWETVAGFYLLIKRTRPSYQVEYDESALTNLLYLVYVLADVNGFDVICGYSDIEGVMLRAVGASTTATGWSSSIRRFSFKRFKRSKSGGGQPGARYTSLPLLNSVQFSTTLASAHELGVLGSLLSGGAYDSQFLSKDPSSIVWPAKTSFLHHMDVLAKLDNEIEKFSDVPKRLDWLEAQIQQATGLKKLLESKGVQFGTMNEQEVWLHSIQNFRNDVQV